MNLRVAIVEDNNIMRYMLRNFLKEHFQVYAFDGGLAFFEWLDNAQMPDLVLTDINMPEMSGFELTSHLKSSQVFKDVAVMVLSGLDDSQDRIKCLNLGAEDYIMKPFNPEELLVKINKYIKNKSDYEQASSFLHQSK